MKGFFDDVLGFTFQFSNAIDILRRGTIVHICIETHFVENRLFYQKCFVKNSRSPSFVNFCLFRLCYRIFDFNLSNGIFQFFVFDFLIISVSFFRMRLILDDPVP